MNLVMTISMVTFPAIKKIEKHILIYCNNMERSTSRMYNKLPLTPHFGTMKLPEEQMKPILSQGVLKLSDIFKKNGFEIRIAGGAVRDMIMGKIPKDLDFATTATPSEMKEMFTKEEVRMINAGGEKHGTITAHIDEENFECTTLRIDKVTDGRHAEVEFIRDWELDAGRRDLTINALFLALDGTIYDYYDGINHINNKIITFVGDPEKRVQEDYLRILRYFRFYGLIAEDPYNHDPNIIKVLKENSSGLTKISGERIWVEIKKILNRRFGGELLTKMLECGMGPHIGLPGDFDCDAMTKTFSRIRNMELDLHTVSPCTFLAGGFESEDAASQFISRIKCSNKEKDILLYVQREKQRLNNLSTKVVKDLLVDIIHRDKKAHSHALSVVSELLIYAGRIDILNELNNEFIPHFPIKGGMLTDVVKNRKEISKYVKKLLELWKNSNYTMTREELMETIKCEL